MICLLEAMLIIADTYVVFLWTVAFLNSVHLQRLDATIGLQTVHKRPSLTVTDIKTQTNTINHNTR